MNERRTLLAMTAALLLLALVAASAEEAADAEGVKVASRSFYATLSVLDDGTAMEKVWARRPYITYLGPQGKSIIVGWDDQKKYWADFNKRFRRRSVSLADAHIHANGDLAWEIGLETGEAQMQDGNTRKVDWFATNVYEKIDGRWLMVSHHVQPKPQ